MMQRGAFLPGFSLSVAGLLVLAAPAAWEGPVLIDVAPGHAIALLDAVGIVPLMFGSVLLFQALWLRRGQLARSVSGRPDVGLAVAFAAGAGLGLLIASAFSGFFWWWAVGAALFACTVVAAVAATTQ